MERGIILYAISIIHILKYVSYISVVVHLSSNESVKNLPIPVLACVSLLRPMYTKTNNWERLKWSPTATMLTGYSSILTPLSNRVICVL